MYIPKVEIYKRIQKSKKTRKQELDQESDQKKESFFYFFLGCFLGRVLVFLLSRSLFWSSSCFLLKIPPSGLV